MGWIILILFLIVVFIVWIALIRSAKQKQSILLTRPQAEQNEEQAEVHQEEIVMEPAGVEEAAAAPSRAPEIALTPDDLKIVEGIGPKVSALLNEAGIFTFEQLANTEVVKLKEILAGANLWMMKPETWPEQARLAADGKLDELKELQDRLIAGRRA